MMRGAVYAFENDRGMHLDGELGPHIWTALLAAVAAHQTSSNGYNYIVVNKSQPERLTIWHNGGEVMSSLVNTSVDPKNPTTDGNWPIVERLPDQVMTGHNMDGSVYHDPVKYVAYFNEDQGEAIHYYLRSGYGYPQSLGCAELPLSAAQEAYNYATYGTIVTVEG